MSFKIRPVLKFVSDEDYALKLKMAGIPGSVIAKGNVAIIEYAQKHGILLPPKMTTKYAPKAEIGDKNISAFEKKEMKMGEIKTKNPLNSLFNANDMQAFNNTSSNVNGSNLDFFA